MVSSPAEHKTIPAKKWRSVEIHPHSAFTSKSVCRDSQIQKMPAKSLNI